MIKSYPSSKPAASPTYLRHCPIVSISFLWVFFFFSRFIEMKLTYNILQITAVQCDAWMHIYIEEELTQWVGLPYVLSFRLGSKAGYADTHLGVFQTYHYPGFVYKQLIHSLGGESRHGPKFSSSYQFLAGNLHHSFTRCSQWEKLARGRRRTLCHFLQLYRTYNYLKIKSWNLNFKESFNLKQSLNESLCSSVANC